jgi:hypothetical protein
MTDHAASVDRSKVGADQTRLNSGTVTSHSAPQEPGNPWITFGLVAVGTFMIMLDASIVNISLPYATIESRLDVVQASGNQCAECPSMSSTHEKRDLVENSQLGVNSYLIKPIDVKEFAGLVQIRGGRWLPSQSEPETITRAWQFL